VRDEQVVQTLAFGAGNQASASRRFRRAPHALAGLTIGLMLPFTTVLAAVSALLVGYIVGGTEIDRRLGRRRSVFLRIGRVIAVLSGFLGMLYFASLLGALVASLIVPLVALSERETAGAPLGDRISARILVVGLAVVVVVSLSVAASQLL
jgi:hypothetical protein